MDSILQSIKHSIGIMPDYTEYDSDIIMFINDALFDLTQNGVGPEEGFVITDDTSKWSDFLDDSKLKFTILNLESAKTYVSIQTRLAFDLPSNTSHIEALQRRAEKCLWRLRHQVETEV